MINDSVRKIIDQLVNLWAVMILFLKTTGYEEAAFVVNSISFYSSVMFFTILMVNGIN